MEILWTTFFTDLADIPEFAPFINKSLLTDRNSIHNNNKQPLEQHPVPPVYDDNNSEKEKKEKKKEEKKK